MTNKGFKTSIEILKLMDEYQSIYENTNQIGYKQFDEIEKFMPHFINSHEGSLIVRFSKSDESKILRTIIGLKNGYITSNNVNFSEMEREKEREIYATWKESITDKRLNEIMGEINMEYHDELQKTFTSIQGDLNK